MTRMGGKRKQAISLADVYPIWVQLVSAAAHVPRGAMIVCMMARCPGEDPSTQDPYPARPFTVGMSTPLTQLDTIKAVCKGDNAQHTYK